MNSLQQFQQQWRPKMEVLGDNYIFSKECSITGEMYVFVVNQVKYHQWKDDCHLIQDVFPEATPEQREFLMTGITPTEWNALALFPDE